MLDGPTWLSNGYLGAVEKVYDSYIYYIYIHNIHNLTYVDISVISYHVVQNNHASIRQYISLLILMNVM